MNFENYKITEWMKKVHGVTTTTGDGMRLFFVCAYILQEDLYPQTQVLVYKVLMLNTSIHPEEHNAQSALQTPLR